MSAKKKAPPAQPSFDLRSMQSWVQEVITHPAGAKAGAKAAQSAKILGEKPSAVHQVIGRSKNLSSLDRIQVYASMYFWRLQECLQQDYPVTLHAVGGERFDEICIEYLKLHPSRHYNLARLGDHFPKFLRNEAKKLKHSKFLADLAALEQSKEHSFDADMNETTLSVDDLLSVPREKWPELRFVMSPSLRIQAFAYPVHDFSQAYRDDRPTEIPGPRATWVATFRREYIVYRLDLTQAEHAVLSTLAEGKTIGDAVEACMSLPGADPEQIGASIGDWFRNWAGKGFFAAIASENPKAVEKPRKRPARAAAKRRN